jgi:hypothetical protein
LDPPVPVCSVWYTLKFLAMFCLFLLVRNSFGCPSYSIGCLPTPTLSFRSYSDQHPKCQETLWKAGKSGWTKAVSSNALNIAEYCFTQKIETLFLD